MRTKWLSTSPDAVAGHNWLVDLELSPCPTGTVSLIGRCRRCYCAYPSSRQTLGRRGKLVALPSLFRVSALIFAMNTLHHHSEHLQSHSKGVQYQIVRQYSHPGRSSSPQ